MDIYKGIGIFFILFTLTLSIGGAYAEEISVDDVKFNIPDGFEKNSTASKYIKDQTGSTSTEVYSNSNTDMIIINVLTPNKNVKYKLPENKEGYINKTIQNIDGIYNEDIHEFIYLDNEKLIFISAHNESLLEESLITK